MSLKAMTGPVCLYPRKSNRYQVFIIKLQQIKLLKKNASLLV